MQNIPKYAVYMGLPQCSVEHDHCFMIFWLFLMKIQVRFWPIIFAGRIRIQAKRDRRQVRLLNKAEIFDHLIKNWISKLISFQLQRGQAQKTNLTCEFADLPFHKICSFPISTVWFLFLMKGTIKHWSLCVLWSRTTQQLAQIKWKLRFGWKQEWEMTFICWICSWTRHD